MPRGDGICGDFQRGACSRGADCRFSHRAEGVKVQGAGGGFKGDGVCGDFQLGKCKRGNDCRYAHVVAREAADKGILGNAPVAGFRGDGLCGDFLRGKCTRDDCRFAHKMPGEVPVPIGPPVPVKETGLCGDFQKGNCMRGADCKFEHRIAGQPASASATAIAAAAVAAQPALQQQLIEVLALAQQTTLPTAPLRALPAVSALPLTSTDILSSILQPTPLPTSAAKPAVSTGAGGGFKGDGICGDFQMGRCKRGDDCRYLHMSAREAAEKGLMGTAPVTGFRGDGLCGDFQRGNCTREDCRYLHTTPDKVDPSDVPMAPFRGDGLCGDFQRGVCRRGEDCLYEHRLPGQVKGEEATEADVSLLEALTGTRATGSGVKRPARGVPTGAGGGFKGDGICGDFQLGKCTRGADCRYAHISAREAAEKGVLGNAPVTGFRGDGLCGDFQRGSCSRGDDCRYAHKLPGEVDPATVPAAGYKGDGLCGDFQRGTCMRGADCRYEHRLPGQPALPNVAAASQQSLLDVLAGSHAAQMQQQILLQVQLQQQILAQQVAAAAAFQQGVNPWLMAGVPGLPYAALPALPAPEIHIYEQPRQRSRSPRR